MCGIAGRVSLDGARSSPEVVARMCAAMEHRGPDAHGIHADEFATIGIQRLRVIDLHTGDQPIYNEDRSIAVVLNGEIYNFPELREGLARRGHRLQTHGDTEVIVHLYEEHGARCVEHLRGMFAFALWDAPRRRLLLARDRVGKKPLFYCCRGSTLSFASELNALTEDDSVPRDIDPAAIDLFLAYQYIPAPWSAFRAVRKLPPASTLTFDDGEVRVSRYWRLDFRDKPDVRDRHALGAELLERMREAVRIRMVADVPLGAFLSGGIDSSTVVALMAEASAAPIRTFSIGFASDRFNELPRARLVAERFGTEHREFVVEPDAVEIAPRVVRQYGEPFADSSAIPSFYLSELARRHVTVALNGDGGDESFGGYQRYVSQDLIRRTDRIPAAARRIAGRIATLVPPGASVDSPLTRIRRIGGLIAVDGPDRYTRYMTRENGLPLDELYAPDYRRSIGDSHVDAVIADPWNRSSAEGLVDRLLDVDVATYLPGDLLVKIDIATMAHSLEARSPLLDHKLMEFAAALPARLKVRGGEKKVILRDAMRDLLPAEILDGPKRGFQVPMAEWLRGPLRPMLADLLLDQTARSRGVFRTPVVEQLIQRHTAGAADYSRGLWTLLAFELWHRQLPTA
jgi:asparagine synthase (glutamine-hydrolysing)